MSENEEVLRAVREDIAHELEEAAKLCWQCAWQKTDYDRGVVQGLRAAAKLVREGKP